MMLFSSALFFVGFSLFVGANCHAISFVDACRINDNECVLTSAKKVMPYIVYGNDTLGINSADPLELKDVDGSTGELELLFDHLVVTGASKCILLEVERPTQFTARLKTECPIQANGGYKVDKLFFGSPIYGHGPCEFKCDKILIEVSITMKLIDGKDGVQHYKISKFDYKYDPIGRVELRFENLYEGNKEKAELVNKVIDSNPKEILISLGNKVIKEIIKEIVNVVDQLFLKLSKKQMDLE